LKKSIALILVGVICSLFSFFNIAAAQNLNDNGRGVNMIKVSFKNNNVTMVGNLYLPANFDKSKKYPAIVVAHPWGGVKEQTSGLYARNLAEQGFIALAYDASHYGESGGEPRFMENPTDRVEDIRSAVDYLSNHNQVDEKRIGALGICAGGGYTISAAQTDLRIKAVAGISTYDVGAAAREGLKNVWPVSDAQRIQILKDAALQRTKEARGEAARIDKLLPTSTPPATAPQFIRDAYDYYNTLRGRQPNATGNFRFTSTIRQMEFFPFEHIETISPRPLLLIAGSEAETLYFSQNAYEKAKDPKELFIITGASHFDMYDKLQYVTPAVAKLAEFFGKNL